MASWTKKQCWNAILAEADHHGTELPPDRVDRLLQYHGLLERWNRRIRLVGRSDAETFIHVHLADALALTAALTRPEVRLQPGATLMDVGSGAGLPGLLVALCSDRLHVTLCEIANKRIAFLQEAIRQVAPEVALRAEAVQRLAAAPERYDHVVSRAVFEPEPWIPLGTALLTSGGWVWSMITRKQADSVDRTRYVVSHSYRLQDGRERLILGFQPPCSP